MKLQLDFYNKIIKLENNVNLGEFLSKIKEIIPEWESWKLETNVSITWNSPTKIIEVEKNPYNRPLTPWYEEWITCNFNNSVTYGICNVEI